MQVARIEQNLEKEQTLSTEEEERKEEYVKPECMAYGSLRVVIKGTGSDNFDATMCAAGPTFLSFCN